MRTSFAPERNRVTNRHCLIVSHNHQVVPEVNSGEARGQKGPNGVLEEAVERNGDDYETVAGMEADVENADVDFVGDASASGIIGFDS